MWKSLQIIFCLKSLVAHIQNYNLKSKTPTDFRDSRLMA